MTWTHCRHSQTTSSIPTIATRSTTRTTMIIKRQLLGPPRNSSSSSPSSKSNRKSSRPPPLSQEMQTRSPRSPGLLVRAFLTAGEISMAPEAGVEWSAALVAQRQPSLLLLLDCHEEQYPCTRLYSIHKPCKQCLNEVCFYSLRRMYVINKEICVRTVCAHEELLRADLCRDKFSKCGVMASSGLCQSVAASCARSCGGC
ncbi:PREDICTED: microfibrillar-associated protein 2 isoform X1 [Hipposideros armiger]|uniref:Microfibrillar-associated protein 2 isoform X1 n=1 Tax=Hipposideros armiger TaxID=186990 RepID=A0A8B7SEU5_HIPAR|nr:PREDICTED: microfibrillar-associated protein 2 isoform X1 [Hipposideros armiger]XP_019510401.1 PREDICTED: microfibrillar-associated protein 2 isoform X1 [Hipposideros armiger]